MAIVETKQLSKSFGDVQALRSLTIDVDVGTLFGLLGPNGAGKTTSIEILTGQLVPDSGTVTVMDTDPVTQGVETRRRVGILPERESPPSFLTPAEYFEFVADVRDLDAEKRVQRIDRWCDRLDFHDQLNTLNTDLSRGQQQKVMIIQAFLHEPPLVFIDEPLVNLDPIMQARLKKYFQSYVGDGNTIVLSTHDIDTAETICDDVGIMSEGQLLTRKQPADLGPSESLLDVFLDTVGATDGVE